MIDKMTIGLRTADHDTLIDLERRLTRIQQRIRTNWPDHPLLTRAANTLIPALTATRDELARRSGRR